MDESMRIGLVVERSDIAAQVAVLLDQYGLPRRTWIKRGDLSQRFVDGEIDLLILDISVYKDEEIAMLRELKGAAPTLPLVIVGDPAWRTKLNLDFPGERNVLLTMPATVESFRDSIRWAIENCERAKPVQRPGEAEDDPIDKLIEATLAIVRGYKKAELRVTHPTNPELIHVSRPLLDALADALDKAGYQR